MSRSNQWFVPGEGIAREVITADIQRYLGPDALVRPGAGTGDYEGRPGYWITAYRTLTSQMIQDLKLDSQRWAAEKDRDQRGHGSGGSPSYARDTKVSRKPDASLVAYQDSRTHASRQHYGPTETYPSTTKAPSYASSYGSTPSPHYTTTPTASYSTHQTYQAPPSHSAHTQPRTDPYANYGQPPGGSRDYQSYPATTPSYSTYAPQPATDPYGRPTATPAYTAPSTASPGYYLASDGRQYPLSQQPQQPPQPPSGSHRRGN